MEENKEKKSKKKIIIIVALLLCVITGISYAYLSYFAGTGANAIIKVSTEQPNDLSFSVDHDLSMTLNQFNFTTEEGNKSDTAIGSATLKANNTDMTAEATYNVYFNILLNEFIYTTGEEKKPEIVLTITDPAGGAITSLPGLNYVTVGDVSGFDVTEVRSGLMHVAQDYPIASRSSKTATKQDWTFTLNFINLETNQKANAGKTFNAKIVLLEDEYVQTFADYLVSTYGTDNSLLLHNAKLINGAGDNSYRFIGANPNNYVCFGSDAEVCPEDNLYRIIGVFNDQVKLIKSTIASSTLLGTDGDYKSGNIYYWNNNTKSNNWVESRLNTINLNTNFANVLGSDWVNKIATAPWYVGGMTMKNGANTNARTAYDYEVGTNADKTEIYNEKIGLMYMSDYYYAAPQSYWTLPGSSESAETDYRKAKDENWMYLGQSEWSITRQSDQTDSTIHIFKDGIVSGAHVIHSTDVNVRPTFYLNNNVKMVSGKGTSTEPYRID